MPRLRPQIRATARDTYLIFHNSQQRSGGTRRLTNNAPDLSLCVCLFAHKIGALQGIGSRRSMPVEGLGEHVLRGCCSSSCSAAEVHDSFVFSPRGDTTFLGRRR